MSTVVKIKKNIISEHVSTVVKIKKNIISKRMSTVVDNYLAYKYGRRDYSPANKK